MPPECVYSYTFRLGVLLNTATVALSTWSKVNAVAIVMLAEGPSFWTAPSGQWRRDFAYRREKFSGTAFGHHWPGLDCLVCSLVQDSEWRSNHHMALTPRQSWSSCEVLYTRTYIRAMTISGSSSLWACGPRPQILWFLSPFSPDDRIGPIRKLREVIGL
jgi:hypothetical protein